MRKLILLALIATAFGQVLVTNPANTAFKPTPANPYYPALAGLRLVISGGSFFNPTTNSTVTLAQQTLFLPDNSTTYVYLLPSSGVITTNTTGFVTNSYPIAIATTSGGQIGKLQDSRPDISSAGAGIPGGSNTQIQINNSGTFAGISSAGTGSVVLANGTSQLKRCSTDWRDAGIIANNGLDQSSAITTAFNNAGSSGCSTQLPSGVITVANSISPTGPLFSWLSEGTSGSGTGGVGTRFNWTGSGTCVFCLDQTRDSIFGRFQIANVGTAQGILLSQLTGFSGISSHDLLHDFFLGQINGGIGVQIGATSGDSQNNNEAHAIWRPNISCTSATDGSSAISSIPSGNIRGISILEPIINTCQTGFNMNGSSWHIIGGLTESLGVATNLNTNVYPVLQMAVHDESSKQGFSSVTGSGGVLAIGNFYEMSNPDLTKYYWDFSGVGTGFPPRTPHVITIGNVMSANASITKMINYSGGGIIISIGDSLPNFTTANLPDIAYNSAGGAIIETANRYTGPNGGVVLAGNTSQNPSGDGTDATATLFQIPATIGTTASHWFNSPQDVLSALYSDGSNNAHLVPYIFRVELSDATGSSAATYKLNPPKDPVTGTSYGGPLNFDYFTNGNNFQVRNMVVADPGVFGSNEISSAVACETSFGATTLNTGGTTTNTGVNCLPANAIIDAVVYRITATITTAASFTIGDSSTAGRFCGTQSTLTAGTTGTCIVQWTSATAGTMGQASAASVRVTTNANPGAGTIRIIVYAHTFTPPTS